MTREEQIEEEQRYLLKLDRPISESGLMKTYRDVVIDRWRKDVASFAYNAEADLAIIRQSVHRLLWWCGERPSFYVTGSRWS